MDIETNRQSLDEIDIPFGSVLICDFPNASSDGRPDGTYKPRPVRVVGHYRDAHGALVALDVFKKTTQTQRYNLSTLFLSNAENGNTKDALIKAQNIITLPIHLFDLRRGVVRDLPNHLLPDLISCRAHALNANPGNQYLNYYDFPDDFTREGIFFNHDLVQPIRSSHNPGIMRPDVEQHVAPATAENCNASCWMNQMEIDAITRWSVAYIKILRANGMDYSSRLKNSPHLVTPWPAKDTWPNWPDVEWNGERIRCCSDQTAQIRDYQRTKQPIINLSAAGPRP